MNITIPQVRVFDILIVEKFNMEKYFFKFLFLPLKQLISKGLMCNSGKMGFQNNNVGGGRKLHTVLLLTETRHHLLPQFQVGSSL
jgi:hypothetical protein